MSSTTAAKDRVNFGTPKIPRLLLKKWKKTRRGKPRNGKRGTKASKPRGVDELKNELDHAVSRVVNLSRTVDEKLDVLSARRAKWKAVARLAAENMDAAPSRMVLNVGGKRFETRKEVLIRIPNTYFTGLLSGPWEPEADGSYFIDRSPKGFDCIMDFLRSGKMDLAHADPGMIARVRDHFDYFSLPKEGTPFFVKSGGWSLELKAPNLTLVEEGSTLVKLDGISRYECSALGCMPNPISFKVTFAALPLVDVQSTGAPGDRRLLIGLAPKSSFSLNSRNYGISGFLVWVQHGVLYSKFPVLAMEPLGSIPDSAIVEVRFDQQKRTITWSVDKTGKSSTVTLPADFKEDLYPAVEFGCPYGWVKWIS